MKETNSSVRDNHEHLDIPRPFSSEAWKELTEKQTKLYLKRLSDGKGDRVKWVYSLSDSWLDYRAEGEGQIHKGA